jgi:hypothetical protein
VNATRRVLSTVWLCAGAALFLWTMVELLEGWESEYRSPRATTASLMFVAFALAAVAGGVLGVGGKRHAAPILITLSWLGLLYATAYVLFGGFDDTGVSYALCVLALVLVCLATLLGRRVLRISGARGGWPAS